MALESIDRIRKHLMQSPCRVAQLDDVHEWLDGIEEEVEERYIELPTDARGVPIRFGDVMEEVPSGRMLKVTNIRYFAYDATEIGGLAERSVLAIDCRHRPPTVEDVLEKALNKAAGLDRDAGYWVSAADITNIVNEIAPKLQLKKED